MWDDSYRKRIKINEFKTEEVLLQYGNHFIRIKNLLRHRAFSEFENKKQILHEIENVKTDLPISV